MSEPKYKLVPVKSGEKQVVAGLIALSRRKLFDAGETIVRDVYEAMISATPSPPQDPRDEALRVAREALEVIKKKGADGSRDWVTSVCDAAEYKIKELMGE